MFSRTVVIDAVSSQESSSIPADPFGAVGQGHLVNVVNNNIEWYLRDGTQKYSETLGNFFLQNGLDTTVFGNSSTNTVFDPKVVYDRFEDRFVVVALSYGGRNSGFNDDEQSYIDVAVSKTGDPNDGWWVQRIDALQNIDGVAGWVDYPGLAVDEEAVYITNNVFSSEGDDYLDSLLWTLDKGAGTNGFYDGGGASFTVTDPSTIDGTLQPAHVIGAQPDGDTGTYLFQRLSFTGNDFVRLIEVTDPLGTISFTTTDIDLGKEVTGFTPFDAPQLGTTVLLDAGDPRALDAVYRDGVIYSVFTAFPDSGPDANQATAYWVELDVDGVTPFLLDQGAIGGEDIAPGTHTYYPSIAVNGNGDVGIGFSASSPSTYAGAYFAVHDNDALDGQIGPSQLVQEGLDFYENTRGGRNRWGDYSGIAIDPLDDQTFWVYNKYAALRDLGAVSNSGEWATVWASFVDTSSTPPEVSIAAPASAVSEGTGDQQTAVFTVTRSGDASGSASVSYVVTPSGLDQADVDDFVGSLFPRGTIHFAGGERTKILPIGIIGDPWFEGDEGFTVTLVDPVGMNLGAQVSAETVIRNDDANAAPVAEAQNFNALIPGDISEQFFSSNDLNGASTANINGPGLDFFTRWTLKASPSGPTTGLDGDMSDAIGVSVRSGFNAPDVSPNGTAISFGTEQYYSVNDGDGIIDLRFDGIDLSGLTNRSLSLSYWVGDAGTYDGTGDFADKLQIFLGTFSAPIEQVLLDLQGADLDAVKVPDDGSANWTTVTFDLEPYLGQPGIPEDDFQILISTQTYEDDETIAIDDVVLRGEALPVAPGTITIARRDAVKAEGADGPTVFTFELTRTGDTTGTATVAYAVTGLGGTPASAADFVGNSLPQGTIAFADGQTTATLAIEVASDSVVEGAEQFQVTLSVPTNSVLGTPSTATGVIADASATEADSLIVTTAQDVVDPLDFQTSLREAIMAANDGDTVRFSASLAGSTLVLTNGALAFNQNLTIDGDTDGDGKADIGIDGGGRSRVMVVQGGSSAARQSVTLESLTVTDGFASVFAPTVFSSELYGGSGLLVGPYADVTVINSSITDNQGVYLQGGGVAVRSGATLSLINTLIADNRAASGGGLHVGQGAAATLTNTVVNANTGYFSGGGLNTAPNAEVVIQNSTLTSNGAGDTGGGVLIQNGGLVQSANSIIAGNSAILYGFDLYVAAGGNFASSGGTILGSSYSGSGSRFITSSDLTLGLGNSFTTQDVFESVVSLSGGVFGGVRADNGGVIETVALNAEPANPALDAGVAELPIDALDLDGDGNIGEPLPVDARGFDRAVFLQARASSVDSGSFELQSSEVTSTVSLSPSLVELSEGNSGSTVFEFMVTRTGDLSGAASVTALVGNGGPGSAEPSDFGADDFPTFTATFGDGDPTAPLTVSVVGDSSPESEIETFILSLINAEGTFIGAPSVARGNILNDDGVGAPVVTVTTALDVVSAVDGETSLREALSAVADGGTIQFDGALSGQTVSLTNGELVIDRNVTINGDTDGDRTADIILDAGGASRVVRIEDGTSNVDERSVRLESLTITGGIASFGTYYSTSRDNRGGGIYVGRDVNLTIVDTLIHDNRASSGGGIAVGSSSSVSLFNSTVSDNYLVFGFGGGGGIFADSGTNILGVNLTVADNMATNGAGGGIEGDAVALYNSTITGNSSGDFGGLGGGVYVNGVLSLSNTIVAGNTYSSSFTVRSDIAGGNYFNGAQGALNSLGGNILGSAPAYFAGALNVSDSVFGDGNSLTEADIFAGPVATYGLDLLADNGGTVPTVALLNMITNPALDGAVGPIPLDPLDLDGDGNTGEDLPVDARGFSRSVDVPGVGLTATDIGAFELQLGNTPPLALNDAVSTDEDTALPSIMVLDNDSDPDAGDTVTLVDIDGAGILGLVTDNADGTLAYDPRGVFDVLPEGASTTEAFTYTISDEAGATATATVTVTVTGVNDAPEARDDALTTDDDTPLSAIPVLDNDSDPDAGDMLTIVSLDTAGTLGAVTDNGDGTVSYDPAMAFDGLGAGATATDQFTYTVRDGFGATSTATVSVTVTGQNNPPVAIDDAFAADAGGLAMGSVFGAESEIIETVLSSAGSAVDVQRYSVVLAAGDPLTLDVTVTTPERTGTGLLDLVLLQDLSGSFSGDLVTLRALAPDLFDSVTALGFDAAFGVASFIDKPVSGFGSTISSFPYRTDLPLTASRGDFLDTINGLDTQPGGDAAESQLEALLQVSLRDLEIGYRPGASRIVVLTTDAPFHVAGDLASVPPNNGDAILDGDPPGSGEDYPSVEQVRNALISAGIVPIFAVTSNRTDVYDDLVTQLGVGAVVVLEADSSNIISVIEESVEISLSTVIGAVSDDDFGYVTSFTPSAGFADVDPGTEVTFSILLETDDPGDLADTLTFSVPGFGVVQIDVEPDVQDFDPDDDDFSVTAVEGVATAVGQSFMLPSGAIVNLAADGVLTYDVNGAFQSLAEGETTTDSFEYTISDVFGATDSALVTVTVTGINDAPEAVDDTVTTDEDTAVASISVLGNDRDPDTGDMLSVESVNTTGTLGSVTDNGDGTLAYDPNGAFETLGVGETATDVFSYSITDGAGETATATVTVTVTGVNDNPVAADDTATTDEEVAVAGLALLANDTDVDGGPLTIFALNGQAVLSGDTVVLGSGALVRLDADGTVTYDPNGQFADLAFGATATDLFAYSVADGNGGSASAQVTVTISGTEPAVLRLVEDTVTLTEGNTGDETVFTFTVERTGNTSGTASATYTVVGTGSDPADDDDFVGGILPTGTVSFADGQVSQTIDIVVSGDLFVEADETFTLILSDPVDAIVADGPLETSSATGTIPETAQDVSLSLTAPDATDAETVNVTGLISLGDLAGSSAFNIVYIIDVSGSTDSDLGGAGAQFVGDASVGDQNGDGNANDVIDAEIAAYKGLTDVLITAGLGGANLQIVPFGTVVDTTFVGAISQDLDRNGTNDAVSFLEGLNGIFPQTDFEPPLQEAISYLSAQTGGENVVFFLTDGMSTVASDFSDEVATLLDPLGLNATIRTIGVGQNADLDTIDLIDDGIANNSAERVLNPQELEAGLIGSDLDPAEIDRLEISVNGVLALTLLPDDLAETPLGLSYTADLAGLDPTLDDTISVRVIFTDTDMTALETNQIVENDLLATPGVLGIIENDDAPGVLDIAADDIALAEGDVGPAAFTFTVTRTGNTTGPASVAYTVTGGGTDPAQADDFIGGVLPSGIVTFADGQVDATITIEVAGDQNVEADEGFTVTLSGAVDATLGFDVAASSTILNDDTVGVLRIVEETITLTEGNTGDQTLFSFTVERVGNTTGGASATFTVSGTGSDPANGADFVGGLLPTGTVSFIDGQSEATIEVLVSGDLMVEADEAFTVSLSDAIDATIQDVADQTTNASTSIPDTGQDVSLSLTAPDATSADTIDVSGFVSLGDAPSSTDLNILYIIDVSGSTDNLFAGSTVGDVNNDGASNTILDAEIVAFTALNESLIATGFGLTDIAVIQFNSAASTVFTGTPVLDASTDGTPDVVEVLRSLNGFGQTSFEAPLQEAIAFLSAQSSGENVIFFVSDGDVPTNDFTDEVDVLIDPAGLDATIRVFGVGTSADIANLDLVDDGLANGTAVLALDPAALEAGLSGSSGVQPADINRLDIFVNGVLTRTLQPTDLVSTPFGLRYNASLAGLDPLADDEITTRVVFTDTDMTTLETSQIVENDLPATPGVLGIIENDDAPGVLTIAADQISLGEGDAGTTNFTFTVTRSGNTTGTASALYTVTGSSADAAQADDFVGGVLPAGMVTFADGQMEATITIEVAGDQVVEADEAFTVTLSNAVDATFGTVIDAASIITNDDVPGVLTISADQDALPEGDTGVTPFSFTVTRTGNLTGTASVLATVAGSGGNPASADDFGGVLPPPVTVTFLDGQDEVSVTIDVTGDTVVEPDETFSVVLSDPTDATLGVEVEAMSTIVNDDSFGALRIVEETIALTEGNLGDETVFTFTVERTGNTTGSASATFTVSGTGSDPADGLDFVGDSLPTGTVTFGDGDALAEISVVVSGDLLPEADETFTVTLSDPVNATLTQTTQQTTSASGTIPETAQDVSLSLTAPDTTVEDTIGVSGFISLGDAVTSDEFNVVYVIDVSGSTSGDFSGGVPVGDLNADGTPDTVLDGEIAGFLALNDSLLVNGLGASDVAVIAFTNSATTVFSGTAQEDLNIDGTPDVVEVLRSLSSGGNTAFGPPLQEAIGFLSGQATGQNFVFFLSDGNASENFLDEVTTLIDPLGLDTTIRAIGIGNGADLDTLDLVDDAIANGSAERVLDPQALQAGLTGGSGVSPADIDRVELFVNGALVETLAPADLVSTPFGLRYAADLSGLDPLADDEIRARVVFTDMDMTALETSQIVENAAGSSGGALGIIINDDTPSELTLAADQISLQEGDTGATTFTFTVTRTGNLTGSASAAYTVAGTGADPASAEDFVGGGFPTGAVTFADGEASATITVEVQGEAVFEADEAFTVTLSDPQSATLGASTQATSTILNDDVPGVLTIASVLANLPEGDTVGATLTFVVVRSVNAAGPVSVDFSVTGIGANGVDADDFPGGVLPSGTVEFADGQAVALVTVPVAGDTLPEANEFVAVTLSNPVGAVLGDSITAVGTVINDDDFGELTIAADQVSLDEGDGGTTVFTFTVSRTGNLTGPSSATFTVAGEGIDPASADDFVGGVFPTGTVMLADGDASATITIEVEGDLAVEGDEAFSVTLSNSAMATLGTDITAQSTIVNDDALGVFTVEPDMAFEFEGDAGLTAFTFRIIRSVNQAEAASVDFAIEGVGSQFFAADGDDFSGGVLPMGRVDFADGEAEQEVTVLVNGDLALELDEDFRIVLSNPVNGVLGADISAVGTIRNDDQPSDEDMVIKLGDEDDLVITGGGDDTICAGNGDNLIFGGDGDNLIEAGKGNDTVTSGDGDDRIHIAKGDNVVDAGDGDNEVGTGKGDDSLTAGAGDDDIDAGDGDNTIDGGEGDNTIFAGRGFDVVTTGAGRDRIDAGGGDNVVESGGGNDIVTTDDGFDFVSGGDGHDRITSMGGDNILLGGDGNDIITAGWGFDSLDGGAGNDRISAGDGNDTITGGEGDDLLTGGFGSDLFVFSGAFGQDVIFDFDQLGNDVLSVTGTGFVFADFDVTGDGLIDAADAALSATVTLSGTSSLSLNFGGSGEILFDGTSALGLEDLQF